MKSLGVLAAFALLSATAACNGNFVLISEPVSSQNYVVEDFYLAARNGEIRTRVLGNPFGAADDGFANGVMAMMLGANLGRTVTYTDSPTGPGSGDYHVILIFNATPRTDPNRLCAGPPRDRPSAGTAVVTLLGAFCLEDSLRSTADGRVGNLSGPGDPRLRELVRGVTLALFPPYDHLDIGGDGGTTDE